ncbi:MAG: PucR family transcriptional regulator ligand-binding domain-containing protein [Anaerolineae bacterium]|nr:PucR family transcriptional regulator ligand-binding domain-containing protein [Anaerolineae bacterium]
MLTVAEALQLDELKGAKVVAGSDGLSRQVGWVHVAGVPDAPNWLNGGELVLTTMINMPDDPAEQQQYIQAMADKGVAALALAVGRYITEAPVHLREVAERTHFPLIEIPFQARFVDIARATNERISQENMALLERALTIHRVLTQLVLDGGDLKRLAETLADLVGQSISIENERFEALAAHNIAAVDEARRYTLSEGRTDPRLVSALEERGILGQIRRTLRPVHIPQMVDVGLEMERILAPIVVHSNIYGYVWIIADDRPISELDELAIESGATIAALMLLHQEALHSAEAALKGGLLAQLIEGENGKQAVLADQALRYGVNLDEPFVLLMVEPADRGSQKLLQLYRRVNRLSSNWQVIIGQFAGEVLVLAQASHDLAALTDAVHRQASAQAGNVRIGVSGVQHGVEGVGAAHGQCQDALAITQQLDDASSTVYFERLGYLHVLYRAGAGALAGNPYAPALRRLADEQQTDLFHTLEVYLDAGGNGVQTAELLMIHRSTLNYRLTRIEEICDARLNDPAVRTNLQIALKLLRLFSEE